MTTTYLRRAKLADLDKMMEIIEEARALLKQDGSPQWQDGHPDRKAIATDISQEISWVLIVGDQIAGIAALQLTHDPTYKDIHNGQWKQPNEPYATIHRVAISSKYRGFGLSKLLFSNLITVGQLQKRSNFRFDTHEKNQRMQKIAQNFGFIRRGEINVVDKNDPKRIAFELNLHRNYKIHKVTNNFMKGLLK